MNTCADILRVMLECDTKSVWSSCAFGSTFRSSKKKETYLGPLAKLLQQISKSIHSKSDEGNSKKMHEIICNRLNKLAINVDHLS